MAKFTHLHVHSEYSLLDGLTKFGPLMDRAKELNMDSIALTDHGGMYGAIKFYFKAKHAGIKPIIGVETYIAKRSRFDKDPKLDSDQYHLILLAKNERGYKNLMKMVSKSYLEGYYYKPRVDFDLLKEYHQDVIALSGCLSGIGQFHYKKGEDALAEQGLLKLYEIFGSDFYIELQRHKSLKELEIVNPKIIAFARKHGLPLVATADSHYLRREDAEAQEILLCIQTQKTINDPNRGLSMIKEPNFYIKSQEEMQELFLDLPEAIENTQRIANQVDIKLTIGKLIYPNFPLPEGKTGDQHLRDLCYERIRHRFPEITEDLQKRLDYELSIIRDKGYPTYFLIVADFTNWAKKQGIGVGPGRGSAAGSLVSYAMGITDLNPIEHKLPFERFLNPERESPPDIDMDFADDRRDEVIAYVTKRYGDDHVAQIITFGTMEARAAVRDAGRALGYSYSDCDRVAKMIPIGAQGSHMTIDKALELSLELQQAYETEPETKRLLDVATKLSGVARHASTHAAGVVISDKPLYEYTPIQRESKGERIVTQYDMYSLDLNASDDAVGLMKMDFLGLRNLTILQKAIEFIKQNRNMTVDLLTIPLNDQRVFDIITSGNTTGIFQIESAGMRRLAKDLRPNTFSDIAAMIALFRPGPMDLIPAFVEGKINASSIKYPHPAIKSVLEETYGIIVYQEQCMEIAVKFAGYTMGTADLLRRAIGKKKKDLMEVEKAKFIDGAQKLHHTKQEAEDIFAMIEKFASYGFNKAHAASYALVTYQTAYMKAHYPTEFMAAVLSAETNAKISGSQKEEKIGDIVTESKRMGITILSPDINLSASGFTIDSVADKGGTIRFGLSAIKNVGEIAIDSIVVERKNGPYKDFQDFLTRVDTEKVNKRVIESLIKAGTMPDFGSRKALLYILDQLLAIIHKDKKLSEKNQVLLFAVDELSSTKQYTLEVPKDLAEFSDLEILRMEKELLGYSTVQRSFLAEYANLSPLISHKLGELAQTAKPDDNITTLGIITSLRKTLTKSSQAEMAFIKLEDETGEQECIVFPRVYEKVRDLLVVNQPVLVVGKIDNREDSQTIIVNQLISPNLPQDQIKSLVSASVGQAQYRSKSNWGTAKNEVPTKRKSEPGFELIIKPGTPRETLELANTMLKQYPGEFPLTIVLEYKTSIKRLKYPGKVDLSEVVKNQLEKLLGVGSLKIST